LEFILIRCIFVVMIRRAIGILVAFAFLAGGFASSATLGACECACCLRAGQPPALSEEAASEAAARDDHSCCRHGEPSSNAGTPTPTEDENGGMRCGAQCDCAVVVAVLTEMPSPRSPRLLGTIDPPADSPPGLSSTPASPPPRTLS
jgi:hypothetical protein